MKILIHSLNFYPELTATGKYTGEMALWLAWQGHEVDVIAGLPHYPEWCVEPGYDDGRYRTESVGGMKVMRVPHFVPTPNAVNGKNRIRMELSFSWKGLRYWLPILFRRQRYDMIIAVCPPMQTALMPLIYGWLRRVPWVFHIQDFQVDAALRLGILDIGRLGSMLYRIENFLLRQATRVSSITAAMCRRAEVKGADPRRIWQFPNWANTGQVRPLPHDNTFRAACGVNPDQVLVMYAGAMGVKQGLDLVIEAAARCADDPRFRFVMVGTGGDRQRLERLARERTLENLSFLPVQPLEALPEMLAAADIHLVVQKTEAADLVMPSKLTNILAAGRPAIATAATDTALHDVLNGHEAGLVVEPGDLDAFCDALHTLAGSAELRERMGRNARAYAERYLDMDRVMRDFEACLSSLVKEACLSSSILVKE